MHRLEQYSQDRKSGGMVDRLPVTRSHIFGCQRQGIPPNVVNGLGKQFSGANEYRVLCHAHPARHFLPTRETAHEGLL